MIRRVFGSAQPAWSVLQSDSVSADQPRKCSATVTYVVKLSSSLHCPIAKRLFRKQFPEITGEDNLTVFLLRESEVPWIEVDLRHFEIFRHGPIIIYTRLPAGVTYYPICTFPASSECLIGISDAVSAFCLRVSVILPTCSLYPNKSVPTLRYSRRHGPIYTGPCPKALHWISEDRLLT